MPKQTFFNLLPEKRRLIEQVALNEFAEHGFDNAVTNRIVSESGIAKGSFYQYFDDIKDLYFHLIDTVISQKLASMEPILEHYQEHCFTHNFNELFRLGMKFADSDPKLYRLGEDFASKKPELVKEFLEKYSPVAQNIYLDLLENAQSRGELRDDLDLTLVATFINALVNQMTLGLFGRPKETRDYVIGCLLEFVERAILREHSCKREENNNVRV